jgi:lysosomal acid lipase/cholesteryl ester hydrolase
VIRRGTISKYDYDNTRHYGQATPPAYDLSTIPNGFPLFLSYGGRTASPTCSGS